MARSAEITTPDLVVLALLTERPRHGYDVHAELERRDVRDWAEISKPQVYYSLRKLAERDLIRPAQGPPGAGPERQVWQLVEAGRRALQAGLAREDWACRRPPPPVLTWLALSPQAPAGAGARVVARRRAFLRDELARERATAASRAAAAEGPGVRAARLMVALTVRQFAVELAWLDEVEAALAPEAASAGPAGQAPREGHVRRVRPAI